jgi:hypothetical protein
LRGRYSGNSRVISVALTPCPKHGVLQMRVPWAGAHSRFTLAFEAFAIKVLLASRSVKAACELLGLSWQAAHQVSRPRAPSARCRGVP